MKTLNDYIKESILDDEDVLISDIKKDTKNPFILLDMLLNQYDEKLNDIPENKINEVVELLKLPKTMRIEPNRFRNRKAQVLSLCDEHSSTITFLMIYKDYIYIDIGPYHKSHEDLFGGKKEWKTYIKDVLIGAFDLKIADRKQIYILNYKRNYNI